MSGRKNSGDRASACSWLTLGLFPAPHRVLWALLGVSPEYRCLSTESGIISEHRSWNAELGVIPEHR